MSSGLELGNKTDGRTHLQPPALLVQLVDGAAALAQLVEEVLDLLRQILVLPPDGVQLLHGLVPGRAQAEQLGALSVSRAESVVATFARTCSRMQILQPHFRPQQINLPFPFLLSFPLS